MVLRHRQQVASRAELDRNSNPKEKEKEKEKKEIIKIKELLEYRKESALNVEQLSRLYGYSMLIIAWNAFVLLIWSSFPHIRWNVNETGKVPLYDPYIYIVSTSLMITIFASLQGTFVVAAVDPATPEMPWYGWKYAFRATLPRMLLMGILLNGFIFAALFFFELDVRFYMLDMVGILIGPVLMMVSEKTYRIYLWKNQLIDDDFTYGRDDYRARRMIEDVNDDDDDDDDDPEEKKKKKKGDKKKKNNSIFNVIISSVNTIFLILVLAGYPTFCIPYFKQKTTTDITRLIIICFIHPIVHESVVMLQRISAMKKHTDFSFHSHFLHIPMTSLSVTFLLEGCFVFYRRFMIAVIEEPAVCLLAIALTGLEEAAIRCTLVERDRWFKSFSSSDNETEEEESGHHRRVWAASISVVMVYEFSAIIVSRIAYIAIRPHRFVYNLGYGFDEKASGMQNVSVVVINMVIELLFEGCIDAMALHIERGRGINFNEFWNMWRINPIAFIGMHMCQTSVSLFMAIWAFASVPSPLYCTSTDPCSCQGAGFGIYEPFCQAISNTNSTNFTGNYYSNNNNNNNQSLKNNSVSNVTYLQSIKSKAQDEYVNISDALGDTLNSLPITLSVLIITAFVFLVSKLYAKIRSAKVIFFIFYVYVYNKNNIYLCFTKIK